MKKFLVTLFISIYFLTPLKSAACDCLAVIYTPEEEFKRADAVFTARTREGVVQEGKAKVFRPIFEVRKIWKGFGKWQDSKGKWKYPITFKPVVKNNCDMWFENDREYFVYAYTNENGSYSVHKCGRSGYLSDAEEDLQHAGDSVQEFDWK